MKYPPQVQFHKQVWNIQFYIVHITKETDIFVLFILSTTNLFYMMS